MITKLRAMLAPPIFTGDEEKTRAAEILNTILLAILSGAALASPLILIASSSTTVYSRLIATLALILLALALLMVMRRGYVRFASTVTVIGVWAIATLTIIFGGGGVRSLGFPGNIVMVIIAGILLGQRGSLGMAVLGIFTGLAFVYGRSIGLIFDPPVPDTDQEIWVIQSIYLTVAAVLLKLGLQGIDRALARARQELAERQRAEEGLRESEEQYRSLFENTPIGIGVVDRSGKILAFNEEIMKPGGYLRQDILEIGHVKKLYYDPGARQEILRLLQEQGRVNKYPVRFKRKDSSPYDTLLTLTPIHLSGQPCVQALVEDISEQKKAEEALRSSEEQYRRLVEHSPYVVAVHRDSKLVYVNKAGVTLMGAKSAEELIGTPILEFVHPDSLPAALKRLNRLRKGKEAPPLEEKFIRRDGKVIDVEVTAYPLIYQDKPAVQVVIRDITESKHAEKALQRQLKELTALHAVAIAATEAASIDELIERVTRVIGESFYPDNFGFLLLNEAGDALKPHPSYRGTSVENTNTEIPLPMGITGKVASTGKALRVGDVRDEPAYYEAAPDTRSELCVPMLLGKRVIGAINAESKKLDFFTKEDERLLATIAGQLATGIEKLRLLEVEQKRHQEAETLREASAAVTSSLDLKQVLDAILLSLNQVVPYDSASTLLLEGDQVRITAARGLPNLELALNKTFPASNALLRVVHQSGRPLILKDAQADPRFEKWAAADAVRGWMGVPLTTRGEVIGYLTLDSYTAGAFDENAASLAQAFAHQAAAALENARLFERTEEQVRRLTALRDIDTAIASSFDLRVTLSILVDHALAQLGADAIDILTYNSDLQNLTYVAGLGFRTATINQANLRIGEGMPSKAVLERKIYIATDLNNDPLFTRRGLLLEGFITYVGAPLIGKGQVKGVMEIFFRRPFTFSPNWNEFLDALVGQAAIAIDNAHLFENLQRSNQDLSLAYDITLEGWGKALELRDKETEGHTRRVTDLTLRLARRMGVTDTELTHIRRGVLLHDIGKMGVPDHILHKAGLLTEDEWDEMRQHPQHAYDLLYPITYLRPALDIPYCHHEKWDGSGYPRGLKGDEIPLAARIFAAVDVWDALLSDRPYRKAWTKKKVVQFIRKEAGTRLDPTIADVFLKMIAEEEENL